MMYFRNGLFCLIVYFSGIGMAVASCETAETIGDCLLETPEIKFSGSEAQEVAELATTLGGAVDIYQHVRNRYEYSLYQGARSGVVNTLQGGRGNDVDLASLLMSMLRSSGIPTRYAVATVRMPAENVMNWLTVEDVALAASIMDDQGIQTVALGENQETIEFEHTWVEALVSYSYYRGAGPDELVDCTVDFDRCTWVPLVPAIKQHLFKGGVIDVSDEVSFDYESYYQAMSSPDDPLANRNPLEIYEDQILDHLRAEYPGSNLEDVARTAEIIPRTPGLLPSSTPFKIVDEKRTYASLAEHDAAVGAGRESAVWEKTAELYASFGPPSGSITFFAGRASLIDLTTKRLTIIYRPDTSGQSADTMITRLGGDPIWTLTVDGSIVVGGQVVQLGTPFRLEVSMDGAPPTVPGQEPETIEATYENLIVGGYYVVATGGETSNWSQVHRAAAELLDANARYPIIKEQDGTPWVDENDDGIVDSGDTLLLEHPEAQDELTGGLMYVAQALYYARLHQALKRISVIDRVTTPIAGFLGVISSVYEVEYLDGTAFSILPGGLLIDMKGIRVNGVWEWDEPEQYSNSTFELLGHVLSSLEHEIWQELTGYDAVSTVRGIQMALANGAELMDIKRNGQLNTIEASWGPLGFAGVAPVPFKRRTTDVFDRRLVTWYLDPDDGEEHAFDAYPAVPDPVLDPLRAGRLHYASGNNIDGWLSNCVDNLEEGIKSAIQQHGSSCSLSTLTLCGGTVYNDVSCDAGLDIVEDYFNDTIQQWGIDFFDYIDENANPGFDPDGHVYREIPPEIDQHSRDRISDIYAATQLASGNFRTEFVIPSKRTVTPWNVFSVFIRKTIADDTGDDSDDVVGLQFAISNDSFVAGGGYVEDDGEALTQSGDVTGEQFDNEHFTDQNLNAFVNNDTVRTPSTVDPVSTVSGNMYHDETDFTIKGRGLDLVFTRTYNAIQPGEAESTPFGPGWTHSWNMALRSNDYGQNPNYTADLAPENENGYTSSITYLNERGGEVNFLVNDGADGNGDYSIEQPTGIFDTLALDTPVQGEYTLTFRNGVRYIFNGDDLMVPDARARLDRIVDPWGNTLSYDYENDRLASVTDNTGIAGRTGISFTWNVQNRIETVQDWTGRTWTYGYDGEGRLVTSTDPLNRVTEYAYSADTHRLSRIARPADRDDDGEPDFLVDFRYYENGKAFDYVNAQGEREVLDYDLYRRRTRVTDPRGFVREYTYDNRGGLTRLTRPDGGISRFSNNADGLRYQRLDALGHETLWSYALDRGLDGGASDSGGNVTRERDALGHSVDRDYGLYDHVTWRKDKSGNEFHTTIYQTTNLGIGALRGKIARREVTLDGERVPLTEYRYDEHGNITQQIDYVDANDPARQRITNATYDDSGLLMIERSVAGTDGSEGPTTSYTHDALGRVLTETVTRVTSPVDPTPLALTTTYDYDAAGRVTAVTNPRGDIARTEYDANGNVLSESVDYRQGDGSLTTRIFAEHAYDRADRRNATTDIDGHTTRYQYDALGNVVTVTDAHGHTTRHEYDAMNRRVATVDANGHRGETTYDPAGRVSAVTDANGHTTTYHYDALGRQTHMTTPEGRQRQFDYDPAGRLSGLLDANAVAGTSPVNGAGHTLTHAYDALGRRTATTDALGGTTTTTYDLLGHVTSITDAMGRTTQFIRDVLGRLIETRDPLIETPLDRVTTATHDALGNKLAETDRNGRTRRYHRDVLGRITRIEDDQGNLIEARDYDAFGDLVTLANPDVTYTYTYDAQHRLTSKTDSRGAKTLAFTYDAVGNLTTKIDYQGEATTYQYDSANRLVALSNPAYLQVSWRYDGAGRLIERTLSNGARSHYRYDADNRLIELTHSAGGEIVHQQQFSHDANGNLTALTTAEGTTTATYDPLNRLLAADYPGEAFDEAFSYDAVGNRLTHTVNTVDGAGAVTGSDTRHYQYDANNRLQALHDTDASGPVLIDYAYDDEGNRTTRADHLTGNATSYLWDRRNRLTTVIEAGATHTYRYDPSGYRIGKSTPSATHRYYLQAEHLEAVYDDTDVIIAQYLRGVIVDEIVNGDVRDETGELVNRTYHHDQHRSVTAHSAHDGTQSASRTYSAFGETREATGTALAIDLAYTGREADPLTGLYYYRARYYDPEIGRFLSEDPIGFEAGVNFYRYVNNNPLSYTDPYGEDIFTLGLSGRLPGFGGGEVGIFIDTDNPNYLVDVGIYSTVDVPYPGEICGITCGGTYFGGTVSLGQDLGSRKDFEGFNDAELTVGGGLNKLPLGASIGIDEANNISSATIHYGPSIGIEAHGTYTNSISVGDLIDSAIGRSNNDANGGFLLYPNKPNYSIVTEVYSK